MANLSLSSPSRRPSASWNQHTPHHGEEWKMRKKTEIEETRKKKKKRGGNQRKKKQEERMKKKKEEEEDALCYTHKSNRNNQE